MKTTRFDQAFADELMAVCTRRTARVPEEDRTTLALTALAAVTGVIIAHAAEDTLDKYCAYLGVLSKLKAEQLRANARVG